MSTYCHRGFARSFGRAAALAAAAACLFGEAAVAQTYDVLTYDVLKAFNTSDGANPYAALIQAADGNLYGTTSSGSSGHGTIFKLDTTGTTFATLHSFAGSDGDGANPYAGLIQDTVGNLYGTTDELVDADYYPPYDVSSGTIFKLDTTGTTFTTLHSFGLPVASPHAGLIQGTDGNLYGTTYQGGSNYAGTIFKIDTTGATFATLHSFAGSDGAFPWAGLIQGTDGNLYGTTSGFTGNYGTIFKINTTGTTFTTLHSFAGSDGANPYASLIQGADGNLYGTTSDGGTSNYGTIFKIDTTGTTFATLHSFAGSDGANPYAGLIQGTGGNFYGTAQHGGPAGGGVVFKFGLGCFFDVPPTDLFSPFICTVARDGITAGCGGDNYCPDSPITRAQMAVFLLKAEHGSSYTPPACKGIFLDVECTPTPAFAVDWIEQLSTEGITGGCGGGDYCPTDPVTRAQMAVFLLRAQHGSGYTPPACHGIFADVPCPGGFAVNWIEQLYAEGVTSGCSSSPLLYCPDSASTRGQMAVFLTKTFNLQ
jgi:uncharacterized repeat protein (TIGR03803 family)